MTNINRQWIVAQPSESEGMCLEAEVFGVREEPIPEPKEGQILIRNKIFACEPLVHAWVKGVPGRIAPLPVGATFKGHAGGEVVASRHPDFSEGDVVHGNLEWADFTLSAGTDVNGVPLSRQVPGFSLATSMITLGMTGLCAYIGLFEIGKPEPGDTVVVSAAAGGIGSIAIQLAGLCGCKVIGIAGGSVKCQRLVGELGADAAIDYKTADMVAELAAAAPRGVNVMFDNVGGSVLDAVLVNLAPFGRVSICGGLGGYDHPEVAVRNTIMLAQRNGTIQGFWYSDYEHRFAEALQRMGDWLQSGQLKEWTHVAQGFDKVPEASRGIFSGANTGKQLVEIA
ncbi:MAG: NADP-dependent oxidoreductase [Gammaproteobacteria bacterium]|jgi:NADPH-dependent curcumin reductase CurA|nr:NADP-dependent oxidoreductase [Gammaproteobacteria bacterium]MBT7369466.1 NADP-dependent oxidoreductase [Gammaproteobacteria bacterium]